MAKLRKNAKWWDEFFYRLERFRNYCIKKRNKEKKEFAVYLMASIPERHKLRYFLRTNCEVDSGTNCWIWSLRKIKNYGQVKWKGRQYRAHRLSYEAFFGEFDQSFYVCHKCDNPICINPHHLFLGDAKDNMMDCYLKGRHTNRFEFGYEPPNRRLANGTVIEIKQLLNDGIQVAEIVAETGIDKHLIADIKRGRSYVNLHHFYDKK